MSVAPQDNENLIGYFSPHPPGNFHAVRGSPSLDAELVGSMPTGSGAWIFRSTVKDYNGMGRWGALAQATLESFEIDVEEGNAWICIKNADGNDLLILASGSFALPVPKKNRCHVNCLCWNLHVAEIVNVSCWLLLLLRRVPPSSIACV